ncbi:hypothetical protein [Burkholderia sp. SCN-KJ]|uniref:hypothetical protein n=1 Tax=Burkholderia sp. SCN-KJ TaxID=2969248 RepID=UPI00214FED86|nr:hypothetical protein [Burkholderia sp. SCN-KJ]MCR4468343.1 hypothetical protein [Burkholderia sp. SCN-KJ]
MKTGGQTHPGQPDAVDGARLDKLRELTRSGREPGHAAARQEGDSVHIHGMWYQSSPHPRVGSRDSNFRQHLASAFITEVAGTSNLPPNVDAHLWTDRRNLKALYTPIVRSNLSELEIPHSMISRTHLKIHLEGEIEALISNFPDPEHRKMFSELFNHPATINIGFRSDIVRLLYGILYTKASVKSGGGKESEFNVHVDIDTLDAGMAKKATKQGFAAYKSGFVDQDFENAKLNLKAAHVSLSQRTVGAGVSPPPSKNEFDKLITQPQKSWSRSIPVDNSSGKPVKISESLRSEGYGTLNKANDVIGMSPHHHEAVQVAKNTLKLLKTGMYDNLDESADFSALEHFERKIQYFGGMLHMMNANGVPDEMNAPSQAELLDYFRLSEKIRKLKPELQAEVNKRSDIIKSNGSSDAEIEAARTQIKAIRNVYKLSGSFIEAFVNKHSYFSQIANVPDSGNPEFKRLFESMLGFDEVSASSGGWKADRLDIDEIELGIDNEGIDFEDGVDALANMRKMIKPSTTDDLDVM